MKSYSRAASLALALLFFSSSFSACTVKEALTASTPVAGPSIALDPANRGEIRSLAFSPTADLLAANTPAGIAVWQVATGELNDTVPSLGNVLAWDNRHNYLVSGDRDDTVRIWQSGNEEPLAVLKGHQPAKGLATEGGAGITALAVSNDGALIASAGRDGKVLLWDSATGRQARQLPNFPAQVTALAFSPDGAQLATAGWDQPVVVWNAQTGQETLRVNEEAGSTYGIAFSSDGRWLATGGKDGEVRVWEAVTGALIQTLDAGAWVNAVAFTPDGDKLAAADQRGRVVMWNTANGQLVHTLSGHSEAVYALAFSHDGQILASSGKGGVIHLWSPTTGDTIRIINAF